MAFFQRVALQFRLVAERDIRGTGKAGLDDVATIQLLAGSKIGVDEFTRQTGRKVIRQLTGVGKGNFKFVGAAGGERLAVYIRKLDATQREVAQTEAYGRKIVDLLVSRKIGQVDIVESQGLQPWRIGSRNGHILFREDQFGGIGNAWHLDRATRLRQHHPLRRNAHQQRCGGMVRQSLPCSYKVFRRD